MDPLDFSDDEIKRQLAALGYMNVTEDRMKQFKKDLYRLIEHDRSMSGSSWFTGVSSPSSNPDLSESDKSKTLASSQPASSLSRFQPHLKVRPCEAQKPELDDDSQHTTMTDPYPYKMPAKKLDTSDDTTGALQMPMQASTSYPPPEARVDTESSTYTSETPTASDDEVSDTLHNSQSLPTRVVRKRKVLRKQSDGTPRVYDESLIEDRGSLYRMHNLSVDDTDPRLSRPVERQRLPPRPHSARPVFKKDVNFEAFLTPDQPPSYIRPMTSHPHTRNLKKTDPVNRYHQYKDCWTHIKAPGEKSHKSLRWEVKAQMMYKEEPAPKPQRVYVPNTYVVPTSKKRSALRWEVRHAMERGLPVPTAFDVY